jgi:GWxTD domain-containing protein
MKHCIYIFILLFAAQSQVYGQRKQALKAYLDHKSFYAPNLGNYVKIQLQFVGYTLKYVPVAEGLQSEVGIQLTVRSGTEVVASDAYRLQSPVMRDSVIDDFYELKRFALKPGTYELEVSLQDLNTDEPAMGGKQSITVSERNTGISLSEIQVAETMMPTQTESTFTKSGYEIIPRISNYYPAEINTIPVYLELYESMPEAQGVGMKQTVIDTRTKEEVEALTRYSKHEVDQVLPVIRAIDISSLNSGEYTLQFSIISKENQVLATQEYFFERSNDRLTDITTENLVLDPAFQSSITDDSVFYYAASLIPISRPAEVRNLIAMLKKKDIEVARKYIQGFWITTSGGINIYEAWMRYKAQVQLVQRLYGNNFMDGFETDRGRVYLQYGPPNSLIIRENSPSEYPYEIWHYDKIKQFSNKRFVFYNPDLVNNAYRLLHSDLIGELQNYRWQQQLSKRTSANGDIDNPNDGNVDHYGGNSKELYRQY